MKLQNALKKLDKNGFTVRKDDWKYQAGIKDDDWVIEFDDVNGRIQSICIRKKDDHADPQTDYFPYFWKDNLTQAINSIQAK